MNSFYSNNIALFARRFPDLYAQHAAAIQAFTAPPAGFKTAQARSGAATAVQNALLLHSAYDPEKEAQKLILTFPGEKNEAAVFSGFGLGYGAAEFTRQFPGKTLILIEPDVAQLLSALYLADWSAVFSHQKLILALGAPQQAVIAVLEQTGLSRCFFFSNPAHESHNAAYFAALRELIGRNRQKDAINQATLEKFGQLWARNTFRNKDFLVRLADVSRYENRAANLPACVLAAGPLLDEILPQLAQLKKRCILICVDTALKACLKNGVQPHFIVVGDPQYWNARHLDGLSAPESILITELAASPAIFRFTCREIILFASLYPPGRFLEEKTGEIGKLGAGGSVAASAWDFARLLGCRHIFTAGLDLSFPAGKTHFKGSTFEERTHTLSGRLHPAETDSCGALHSAISFEACDYEGKPVLTDRRLSLYAWWFESKCAAFPRQKTYTFSKRGLRIPGIEPVKIAAALSLPEREAEIAAAVQIQPPPPAKETLQEKRAKLQEAVGKTRRHLLAVQKGAAQILDLCARAAAGAPGEAEQKNLLQKIAALDGQLKQSDGAALMGLSCEENPPGTQDGPQSREEIARCERFYSRLRRSVGELLALV